MSSEDEKKEHIQAIRQRLYDRSFTPKRNQRTQLEETTTQEQAPHAWGSETIEPMVPLKEDVEFQKDMRKRKKKYRSYLMIFGLLFFIVTVGLSSMFFLLKPPISNENIYLSVSGPTSVGGGEIVELELEISNQNTVPLQSTVLNVRFPNGTQSPEADGEELLRQVVQLDRIEPGETVKVPVRAQLFGEEDEEKQIFAEIEYRLPDSGGIFKAEAETYLVKINSSPVSIAVKGVQQISSGQPVDLELVVRSNSQTTLHDLVVKADYPFGFDFTNSSPEPVSGQNIWLVETLEPGESETINVEGVVTGLPADERIIKASVGVASGQNNYDMSSVFSLADLQYEIEEQFISLDVQINGDSSETVVASDDKRVAVTLVFTNPLDSALYDSEIVVELSGTALNESAVLVNEGFYDSIKNAVIFDHTSRSDLEVIQPGSKVLMTFNISPDKLVKQTPEINMVISAEARRVRESNVAESLVGNINRTLRFASDINLLTSVAYKGGEIPPVAEKLTQYTISMLVEGGTNEMENAEVTATLPRYVSWLDLTNGDGTVTFNPSSRTILWNIGEVGDNTDSVVSFTVGFLPSISQVGESPTLLSSQNFKATDKFTGTVIRDSHKAVTIELSSEMGYTQEDGIVLRTAE